MTDPQSPVPPLAPDAARDRFARVARVRLRARGTTVDQRMSVVAAVLLPFGLVMVFFGWYGASRTPYLFEQVPYLVSGGLLGLGLTMTGGFVLFGAWIARTSREQRVQSAELLEAVRSVREEIARLPLPEPPPVPEAPPSQRGRRSAAVATSGNGTAAGGHGLVATARGSMLHRPDCAIVAGREDLRDVQDTDLGRLRPCRLCASLGADQRTTA